MSVAASASASSKTSEGAQKALSAASPAAWLAELRRRGHRGQVVPTHRALTRYVLRAADLVTAVAVMIAVLFIWLAVLPRVCGLWQRIFAFSVERVGLRAEIVGLPYHLTPYLHFAIPSLELNAPLPTPQVWWGTTILCVAVLGVTFLLPRNMLPIVYLLRGLLLVQGSAQAYFAIISSQFVHTANDYMAGMVTTELIFISVVPMLYAFTYYIFDFGLIKKFTLTAITMAHLTLFVPLQLLLHARLLQLSVMFMPVLYVVFGLMLDVLVVIAFYAWGMSWEFRKSHSR